MDQRKHKVSSRRPELNMEQIYSHRPAFLNTSGDFDIKARYQRGRGTVTVTNS